MKTIICIIGLLAFATGLSDAHASNATRQTQSAEQDSTIETLLKKSQQLFNQQPDSARILAIQAIDLAKQQSRIEARGKAYINLGLAERGLGKIQDAKAAYIKALNIFRSCCDSLKVAEAMVSVGRTYQAEGDYTNALDYQIKALRMREAYGAPPKDLASSNGGIGNLYRLIDDYKQSEVYTLKALQIRKQVNDPYIGFSYNSLGLLYEDLKDYDKALDWFQQALPAFKAVDNRQFIEVTYRNMGNVYTEKEEYTLALSFYQLALVIARQMKSKEKLLRLNYRLGVLQQKQDQHTKAIHYFEKSLKLSQEVGKSISVQEAYEKLSECHAQLGNYQLAFEYYKGFTDSKKRLFNDRSDQRLSELKTQFETEQKESAINMLYNERRFLIIGIGLFGLLCLYIFRSSMIRRRKNRQLRQQKSEMEQLLKEKEELFEKLNESHTQLAQAEKMASLGQLTAGVAHEINNPINFMVSNVSALKLDFEDLMQVIDKVQQLQEQSNSEQIKDIINTAKTIDIQFIQEEIHQLISGIERGADRTKNIVDSLKIFSRDSGERFEHADIHEGIDSTLVILNSKISSKIRVHKQYQQLPQIECQAGKLNQVFLNIINNAIQAIHEKPSAEGDIYISTARHEDAISISIMDTGQGMSQDTQKHIFDPFFTTKEIGKGTGLGMSISYGIIEQHKGRIEIDSDIGRGSTFTITLPINHSQQS